MMAAASTSKGITASEALQAADRAEISDSEALDDRPTRGQDIREVNAALSVKRNITYYIESYPYIKRTPYSIPASDWRPILNTASDRQPVADRLPIAYVSDWRPLTNCLQTFGLPYDYGWRPQYTDGSPERASKNDRCAEYRYVHSDAVQTPVQTPILYLGNTMVRTGVWSGRDIRRIRHNKGIYQTNRLSKSLKSKSKYTRTTMPTIFVLFCHARPVSSRCKCRGRHLCTIWIMSLFSSCFLAQTERNFKPSSTQLKHTGAR